MPIASAVGASPGAATADGVGLAALVTIGSSDGSSTATGWRPSPAFGEVFGTSVVTASSRIVFVAAGLSAGSTSSAATSAKTASGGGSSSGVATASATGRTIREAPASSAGAATATAVGKATVARIGASAGVGTAAAFSSSAVGLSGGSATAQALTSNFVPAYGYAEGVATAQAFFSGSYGTALSAATVSGVATSTLAAVGYSAGVATVRGSSLLQLLSMDFVSRRISTVDTPSWFTATHTDLLSDSMYFVLLDGVYTQQVGTTLTGVWRGKRVVADHHPTFAWLRLEGPVTSAVVRLYADGELFYTTPAITDNTPVRLPAGRAREWEIELESTSQITQIVLATTSDELRMES